MPASPVRSCWRRHYIRQARRALCSERLLPPGDAVREPATTTATAGGRYRKASSRRGGGPRAADARSGGPAGARQPRPTRDLSPDTPRELRAAATADRPPATGAGCSRHSLLRSGRCATDWCHLATYQVYLVREPALMEIRLNFAEVFDVE